MAIAKIEHQQVIGALKATGSSDPDVLFARKEELLAETRRVKMLGTVPLVIGGILTVTIVGAIVGIPMILFGVMMRKRIHKNMETADAAYAEYLSSLGLSASSMGARVAGNAR
jgi:hypothetical protein